MRQQRQELLIEIKSMCSQVSRCLVSGVGFGIGVGATMGNSILGVASAIKDHVAFAIANQLKSQRQL